VASRSRARPCNSFSTPSKITASTPKGPLFNCVEYVELRRRIDIDELKPKPANDPT
jgi:hypothetical protein